MCSVNSFGAVLRDLSLSNLVVSNDIVACKNVSASDVNANNVNGNHLLASTLNGVLIPDPVEWGKNGTNGTDGAQGPAGPAGPQGPAGTTNFPSYLISQTLYVDLAGNDGTADGSPILPYATIGAALAAIPPPPGTSIPSTYRWLIVVGPGSYSMPTFQLPPGIWIQGSGYGSTRLAVTGTNITLSPTFSTITGRCGISNILISGTNNRLNFNLQTIGGSGSSVVELNNIHVNGLVTFRARSSADSIEVWGCQFLSGLSVSGGAGIFTNSYIPSPSLFDTAGVSDFGAMDCMNCYFDSTVDVTGTVGQPITMKFTGANITGTFSITGTGASTVSADSSVIGNISVTGTINFVRLSNAFGLAYIPASNANWNGTPPTNVAEALDRIAAKITPIP